MASNVLATDASEDMLEIHVLPDLIDFSKVRYAKVALAYRDPDNAINETGELVFVADAEDAAVWRVPLKDGSRNAYEWRATFVMADGSTQETAPVISHELTLLPQAA